MASLRQIHRSMTRREPVVLHDGRRGKVVRVDTHFPDNETTVSVWTETPAGPGVAKVALRDVVATEPDNKIA